MQSLLSNLHQSSYKLFKTFSVIFLFSLSLCASQIKYAPIAVGDIVTFVPYSHVNISLGNDKLFLENEVKILTINVSHPNDIVSYEWKEKNILIGSDATFSTKNLSPGIHTITLTVIDSNGLSVSDEIIIKIYSLNNINSNLVYSGIEKKVSLNSLNSIKFMKMTVSTLGNVFSSIDWKNNIKSTNSLVKSNVILRGYTSLGIDYVVNDFKEGSISGSLKVSVVDIDNKHFKIIRKFVNYRDLKNPDVVIHGEIIMNITKDTSGNEVESIMTHYDNIVCIFPKNSITYNGNVEKKYDLDGYSIIENYILKDTQNIISLKYDNFITKYTNSKNVNGQNIKLISYDGKLYNSKEGYVEVKTNKERKSQDNISKPEGELLFQGLNSSFIAKYTYKNNIRLEINSHEGSNDVIILSNDKSKILKEKSNSSPLIYVKFPKDIFTNTNMIDINITIYDPDLDNINNIIYEWKVNGLVVSNMLIIDSQLFKKHDLLELKIIAIDDNIKDQKQSTSIVQQRVLNSRPIINAVFESLELAIGDTSELTYTITDLDGDDINITWLNYLNGYFEDEWINQIRCEVAIEKYNRAHENNHFNMLSEYEKEDVKNQYCPIIVHGQLVSDIFVNSTEYNAIVTGNFIHQMTVSDGEYNRTAYMEANISKSDIIDYIVYNHNQYNTGKAYSVYMKDFNNDGNKDLIYITYITRHDDGDENIPPMDYNVPQLVVELRNGDIVINKYIYDIKNLELNDFYVNDINGDNKLDIIFSHTNNYSPPTNNRFSIMYQNTSGLLDAEVDMNLSNYTSMFIGDIIGNGGEEIILSTTDGWNDSGIHLYGVDTNRTLYFSLPNIINHYGVKRKILIHDMDNNGKKDIIIANKSFRDENNTLTFMCSRLLQDVNGDFIEQNFEKILETNLTEYSSINDIVITDILNKRNVFIISTTNHIYFLEIVNNHLEILKKLNYFNKINYKKNTHMNAKLVIEDINHDTKKDILLVDTSNFLNVFIQLDDNIYLTEQSYSVLNHLETKFVFGDINKDMNYEMFLSTGDNNLSTIYFK